MNNDDFTPLVMMTMVMLGSLTVAFILLLTPFMDFTLRELLSIPFFLIALWISLDLAMTGNGLFKTRTERRQRGHQMALRERLNRDR